MEVQDDIDEEDDVHDAVDDQQRDVVHCLILEGDIEGDHDCCVKGEDEDDPVPGGFEGGVV